MEEHRRRVAGVRRVFRLAGEINSEQSPSEALLNRVIADLRKIAIEIIKTFAESLPVKK